jgi:hypothetical protein
VAGPLRFRYSPARWTEGKVRSEIHQSLDSNIGATMGSPWFKPPEGYEARRFEMDNGDIALFCWNDEEGYWLGNTETPSTLWRTDKYGFDHVPSGVAEWAERELLAQLHEEAPWLEDYPTLSWFFLPVLLAKDGRHTSQKFLKEHAAGFPDADYQDALQFYEEFLSSDVFENRYVMAGKLGVAENLDLGRMSSAMSEFTAAKLLFDAGYEVTPEIEVTTGHFIDFRADRDDEGQSHLVEVTRPRPPEHRAASSAVTALRETARTKTTGQLQEHGGGITLLVDCSSFTHDQWDAVCAEKPDVHHRPAVVFRARPDGSVAGYTQGSVPVDMPPNFDHC